MQPNPSDPERTVSVAIVATRLGPERLGELRREPRPRRRACGSHKLVPRLCAAGCANSAVRESLAVCREIG
jgi:hypothetical protein